MELSLDKHLSYDVASKMRTFIPPIGLDIFCGIVQNTWLDYRTNSQEQDHTDMAHSLSAKKRNRQNIKRRALNRWRKDRYRTVIKEYRETLLHGSNEQAEEQLKGIYKMLDQVASTSTIHKNTAARYKSRLARRLNQKVAAAAK